MSVTLSNRQASVAVLIAAIIWGIYWIPVRVLTELGLSGTAAVLALNLPAAVVAWLWLALRWQAERAHLRRGLVIGACGGMGLALFSLAIVETSVIRATLLFYLMPVWGTLLGFVWLGEQPTWPRWVAIGAGVLGLLVLLIGEPGGGAVNWGDAMALVAGWSWALAAALVKRAGSVPLGGMLSAQFLCVCLTAAFLGRALGGVAWPEFDALLTAAPLALAASLLAVLPATAMIFWGSQFLFPGRVGLLLMGEVAVAVVTASLLLPEERLAPLQWAAVVLILGAALIEVWPERKRRPA